MGCPAEVEIGDDLVFSVTTHKFDTGVLTDADSVPSYRIYEDETGTAILTGSMAKLDDTNTTGFYSESLACTSANGFENGKSYSVYISATVNSVTGGISYGFKAYDQRKANVTQYGGVAGTFDSGYPEVNVFAWGGQVGTVDNVGQIFGNDYLDVYDQTNNKLLVRHAGTIQTLDALDTAQDSQHATTQSTLSTVSTNVSTLVSKLTTGIGTTLVRVLGVLAGKSADASALSDITGTAGGATYDNATHSQESLQEDISEIGAGAGGALAFPAEADNTGGAIKSVTFSGTVDSGTFANTQSENGVYHEISGASAIDVVYQFDVGVGLTAVELDFAGYLAGSNDSINIQAYDYVGDDWETIRIITGQGGTGNVSRSIALLAKHTGMAGADDGKVLIRFVCSGQTGPALFVDLLVVEAVATGLSTHSEADVVQAMFTQDSGETYGSAVAGSPVKEITDNTSGLALSDVISDGQTAGTIGKALENSLDYLDTSVSGVSGTSGAGDTSVTITVTIDSGSEADIAVWVTNTTTYSDVVAGTLYTDDNSQVTFLLDREVQYYLWADKSGSGSIQASPFYLNSGGTLVEGTL